MYATADRRMLSFSHPAVIIITWSFLFGLSIERPRIRVPMFLCNNFDCYDRVLRNLINKLVPLVKLRQRRQRLVKWMDSECFNLRRHSRRLEKQYRRTLSDDDRLAWVIHERHRHQVYRQKESAYWNLKLSAKLQLLRTVNSTIVCQKVRQVGPTAQQLLDFFSAKVDLLRSSTANCSVQISLDPSPIVFDTFSICSEEEVRKTICSVESKTCELHPLSTDVPKRFLPELLPFITDMCNASLQQGCLSHSQRRSNVTRRLKKEGMDTADVKSYRLISNLTFMSKTIERLVCRQLVTFLDKNDLLPTHQSAYRRHHSTETAMLKIVSDLLLACDRGQVNATCFTWLVGRIWYGGPWNFARPSVMILRNTQHCSRVDPVFHYKSCANSQLRRWVVNWV